MKMPWLLSLAFTALFLPGRAATVPEFNSQTRTLPPLSLIDSIKGGTTSRPPQTGSLLFRSPTVAARPTARLVTREFGIPILKPNETVDYKLNVLAPDPTVDFKLTVKVPAIGAEK